MTNNIEQTFEPTEEYDVVASSSAWELVNSVNQMLRKGWVTTGGVMVIGASSKFYSSTFYQAIKREIRMVTD